MAEETLTVVAPANPFAKDGWSETPPEPIIPAAATPAATVSPVVPATPEATPSATPATTVATPPEEEAVDTNTWLKNKWGFENEEAADTEIKILREKASKGYEYKNDESRKLAEYINEGKIDDLYNFLDVQKKVDKLSKADLTDKNVATELVKFGIQKDNPTLNADEVDFLFNEKYSLPSKPIQGDDLDDEYSQKVEAWKTQVSNIEKRLVIEAKMNQPKLAQLKTELVLPDIKKVEVPNPNTPTQEELDKVEGVRKSYLSKLESDYKNFKGYDIKYKDEEVEIPVSFAIPEDEKIALKKELENFDVDGFVLSRWFNQDGSPNIMQMMDDVTLLRNKEKAFQKIANEVGAQMKLHYMGKKSNVVVNGHQPVINQNEQTPLQEEIAYLWKQR